MRGRKRGRGKEWCMWRARGRRAEVERKSKKKRRDANSNSLCASSQTTTSTVTMNLYTGTIGRIVIMLVLKSHNKLSELYSTCGLPLVRSSISSNTCF